MRKTLAIITMAAAVLLTQCRKPSVEFPTPKPANTVSMTITAGPGRTDISGLTGRIVWSSDDVIYVGQGGTCIGHLGITDGVGEATGTFTGDVTAPTSGTFHFFYLGHNNGIDPASMNGKSSTTVSFASQDITADDNGNLTNASKHHVGYGKVEGVEVTGGALTGLNVTLRSQMAIAYFDFKDGEKPYTGALNIEGTNIYNTMKVDFDGNFTHGETAGTISLTNMTNSKKYAMLVPTESTGSETLNFTGNATGSVTFTSGIDANKFYCVDQGDPIEVTVTAAPAPTHETVNFGTPNLDWSVCNLGASNGTTAESWYGDYYAWGATETWYSAGGQTSSPTWKDGYSDGYSWAHCPFTNGTYSSSNKKVFTKYIPTNNPEYWAGDEDHPDPDNKLVLDLEDDAATANWGSGWRMPTSAEWESLYDNNTFEWLEAGSTSAKVTSFKAVAAGYLVVKGTGESIDPDVYMFLPAAGERFELSLDAGSCGGYWSGSLDVSTPRGANKWYFESDWGPGTRNGARTVGCAVRPVRPVR